MATPTYELIESTTITTAASNFKFENIPTDGTYRDLVLVTDITMGVFDFLKIRFNDNFFGNYNWVEMQGTAPSSEGSNSFNNEEQIDIPTVLAHPRHTMRLQIFDYAETDKHKSFLINIQRPGTSVQAWAGRFAQTTAISSINIFEIVGGNGLAVGSTLSLYGIAG